MAAIANMICVSSLSHMLGPLDDVVLVVRHEITGSCGRSSTRQTLFTILPHLQSTPFITSARRRGYVFVAVCVSVCLCACVRVCVRMCVCVSKISKQ